MRVHLGRQLARTDVVRLATDLPERRTHIIIITRQRREREKTRMNPNLNPKITLNLSLLSRLGFKVSGLWSRPHHPNPPERKRERLLLLLLLLRLGISMM